MVLRRRVLWIGMTPVLALLVAISIDLRYVGDEPVARIANLATACTTILGLGLAVSLTGFFHDGWHGMGEVLAATPRRRLSVLAVKVIATSTLVVPVLVILAAAGLVSGLRGYGWQGLAATPIVFLIVVLPGAAVAVALAAAAGAWLPSLAARVVALAVWGWATMFSPLVIPVPSLTGTPMSPTGEYAAQGLFGSPGGYAGHGLLFGPDPTPAWGAASVAMLFTLAVALLCLGAARNR